MFPAFVCFGGRPRFSAIKLSLIQQIQFIPALLDWNRGYKEKSILTLGCKSNEARTSKVPLRKMKKFFGHIWGNAHAALNLTRGSGFADLLLLGGIAGIVFGLFNFSNEWAAPSSENTLIDLSPWALPKYTFFSLSRGIIAYIFSLLFTLLYGYWAAKDKIAQRVLIPLLDILQSLPVLAFLPVVSITLMNLFKNNKIGLELVVIVMIFTGQAWNMTFSFFHSINSIPIEMREAAAVYRLNWWERFKWMELPYSMMGLVWNSMMSMAGGWFFLMVCESFTLNDKPYSLPGIGAYMAAACALDDPHKRHTAQFWAILAMVLMIVLLDQLLWRPVVVWAQKFRVEEGGAQENATSWFLDFLRRSKILALLEKIFSHNEKPTPLTAADALKPIAQALPSSALPDINKLNIVGKTVSTLVFVFFMGGLVWGGVKLLLLLLQVGGKDWMEIGVGALATFARVMAVTVVGTLWALPAGLAIGLSPKLSRILQPVVQVAASFPAPMLYAVVWLVLKPLGLNTVAMVLMLLGTQWYILFNVIAGAMAIPADLKEMSHSFGVTGWQRFWTLYAPACFPYLVTGWVTAAGGAWNASIVSEYLVIGSATPEKAIGLGRKISEVAGVAGQEPILAASVVVMSAMVVLFNRFVWKRLYDLAETRFSLSK